ncbi:MAG TPA: hypothetical protein VF092_19065 [Longimicrobium sp.]
MSDATKTVPVLPRTPAEPPALPAAAAPALRPDVEPWEPDLWPENECIPDDELDCEC